MATNNSINTLNTSGGSSSSMQLLQLGIGGAPTSLQDLKITGTATPWALTDNSTRTSTSSNTQSSFFSSATFFPTSGATTCANIYAQPFFKTPTATTITTSAGFYYTANYTGNVGTLTNTYGVFIDSDTGAAGTISNSYGIRVVAPSQATTKYTAHFDAGVGVGQTNSTTATYALAVTGGLQVTTGFLNLPTSTSTNGNLSINGVSYFHNGGVATSVFAGPAAGTYGSTSSTNAIGIGNGPLTNLSSATDCIAIGRVAGAQLTTGDENIYIGVGAGQYNQTGSKNTAVGGYALDGLSPNSNSNNTAVGWASLTKISTGTDNTAVGISTGQELTTGQFNVLVGNGTGAAITTGSTNLLFGSGAGSAITTGNTNIIVGDHPGSTTQTNTIRIGYGGAGTAVFTKCFVDGISGQTTGIATILPALCDTNGQLGTISSLRELKENIVDMGDKSSSIMKLRPVNFTFIKHKDQTYKKFVKDQASLDGKVSFEDYTYLQYGLIAEEVEEVFPDLASYDSEGNLISVRYHDLPVILLNEMQKQQATISTLEARLAALETKVGA